MKFIISNADFEDKNLSKLPIELIHKNIGNFNLFLENAYELVDSKTHCCIVDGYLRDLHSENKDPELHTIRAIKEIINGWPVPENITGSFSTVIIDKETSEIILCNDLIGIYPLYHLKIEENIFISNSIILIGHFSDCNFDEVGIAQRCIGPEYSNMGSRTILENCKRLLPGEYIKMDFNGNIKCLEYDNTLYQNISSSKQDHNLYKNYWDSFKKEVDYCLLGFGNINIALSGGLDSRLLLGAVSENKNIKCLTYGDKENYETKIAALLARLKNAEFENFSELDLYFPSAEILKDYTFKTEAVNVCSWLEILENANLEKRNPLLLGDMAEAISGRNIKKFSSRNYRQKNFLNYYILKKDFQFEKSDSQKFENWKKKTLHHYDRWYTEERISTLNIGKTSPHLVNGLHSDLEEIFTRIEAHNLPSVELYDELFLWYTHSRIPMGKQILICNRKFFSYCPPMSMSIIRNTSNIHPNLRLANRFLNNLFKIKELRKLNQIPTNQAPLIPQNFPNLIKFPIWGIRSKIDHYLIKRLLRKKDPNKRYRLFKSINWALVYQNPEMEENLKDYYKNNHLGEGYFDFFYDQAVQRKELKQWPFANTAIISGASLNLEIDIIKSLK